jgi:spermidine synthase
MTSNDKTPRVIAAGLLGFFALAAQALLFHNFLAAFGGGELGAGAFFASWLAWVAAGAVAGRSNAVAMERASRLLPLLAIAQIPAFILQQTLISHAPGFIGARAYEVFPILPIFPIAFILNAPTSFLTGLLFTFACRGKNGAAATRAYIAETFGGCLGGAFATFALNAHLSREMIFLSTSALLLAGCVGTGIMAFAPLGTRPRRFAATAISCTFFLCLMAIVPLAANYWSDVNERFIWTRLLPSEEREGGFATAFERYAHGRREGQFIVMSEYGVCDALPPDEHAAEIIALHLAQKNDARNALIFGKNVFGVCEDLLKLPQIERVTWLDADPEYPEAIRRVARDQNTGGLSLKLETPKQDARAWVSSTNNRYDLVLLNLPDATSLAMNRYCTREFFSSIAKVLTPNGVVSARVSGGANYIGGELAALGASLLSTMQSTFKSIALKPGDETWLLASNGAELTQAPATLRDRFATVPGGAALYPPEGLPALYPPDRVDFQLNAYRAALENEGPDASFNTDYEPKALFYGLLIAIRQAGFRGIAASLFKSRQAVVWAFAAPILLYALLRLLRRMEIARISGPGIKALNAFDSRFLIFSTGMSSMATSVILMFMHQARFGSLALDIGLIASTFMLGSALGGFASNRFLAKSFQTSDATLLITVPAYAALLLAAAFAPRPESRAAWFGMMGAAGFLAGLYFPMAAARLQHLGATSGQTGASLECLDHTGGAIGALLTGSLILPILGGKTALALMAGLIFTNAVIALAPKISAVSTRGKMRLSKPSHPARYVAFGIAAYAIIVSQAVEMSRSRDDHVAMERAAREMVSEATLRPSDARTKDGASFSCFTVIAQDGKLAGYIFPTTPWAAETPGYGGEIDAALFVSPDGALRDYRILRSKETPAYMALVESKRDRFIGRGLFAPDPYKGVDIISGATITFDAMTASFTNAGRGFASAALDAAPVETAQNPANANRSGRRMLECAWLVTSAIIATFLRPHANAWTRRALLFATLAISGVLLNLQYSTLHLASLLSLNANAPGLNPPFLLTVGVPLLVVILGNVYCGWLCPFGALQELLFDVKRTIFRTPAPPISQKTRRLTRDIRYAVLFAFVMAYALTRDYAALAADPLTTIFGAGASGFIIAITAIAIAFSLTHQRFWCRALCPVGAFLSLLNLRAILRGPRLPERETTPCRLGFDAQCSTSRDCIQCGCRSQIIETDFTTKSTPILRDAAFIIAALLLAFAICGATIQNTGAISRSAQTIQDAPQAKGAGKPRDLDSNQVKELIRGGGLSSHEAQFYTPLETESKESVLGQE